MDANQITRLTGVSSCVPFEIEGVVEAFAADPAQVALVRAVALQVSVQMTLEIESLLADMALWFSSFVIFCCWACCMSRIKRHFKQTY